LGGFDFKIIINKTTFKTLLWHDIILPWVILIYIYNYRLIFNWFSGKTIFFTTTSNKHKIMYMSSSYSTMGLTVSLTITEQRKKKDIYVYMNIICLSFWSKRLNRSGSSFLWDLLWPQVRFMDDRIFKHLSLTKFDFWKFWKYANVFYIKSAKFFVLQCVQRENEKSVLQA